MSDAVRFGLLALAAMLIIGGRQYGLEESKHEMAGTHRQEVGGAFIGVGFIIVFVALWP